MSDHLPNILATDPLHAVPGGRIAIQGSGFDTGRAHAHRVFFGDRRAQVMRVSARTISTVVPNQAMPEVRVERDGVSSGTYSISLADRIADELQPVQNPVFDREGKLYVAFSGSRGEKVPVSVYCIDGDGEIEPFVSDILNPTGLAWGPDDCLYVSSREEGTVYRVSSDREAELVADELGTATGLAFDPEGILYVGDRRGTIFRIEPNGEPRSFVHLEPSVAAYHMVFDGEGNLFVTAPSLASVDPVYRIDVHAQVTKAYEGFGRPQGMAFDDEGTLYVTEGLIGGSGVYRIRPDGSPERVVASPPLVGLAFDGTGGLVLAGSSTVYRLALEH